MYRGNIKTLGRNERQYQGTYSNLDTTIAENVIEPSMSDNRSDEEGIPSESEKTHLIECVYKVLNIFYINIYIFK